MLLMFLHQFYVNPLATLSSPMTILIIITKVAMEVCLTKKLIVASKFSFPLNAYSASQYPKFAPQTLDLCNRRPLPATLFLSVLL